ncbi:MAG: glycosyltransferase family 39 protein [Nitrospinota bacterium]|nr:glycosyltransferase family 39 protein [Nitrospinota bacterium]
MIKSKNPYLFWSLAFILSGIAVRLIHIDLPILEGAITRQIQTATITRNLLANGFDVLHPQIDQLPEPRFYAIEPPVYNSIVALLYLIFGVHESLGRLVSILFFAGTAGFIFRIASRHVNESVARAAVFVFCFSPLSIIFTRGFQPDSTALFFSTACLFYSIEWIRGNTKAYTPALVFALVAFLTKQTLMFVLLPIGLYALRQQGSSVFKNLKLYLLFGLAILPGVLWSWHAKHLVKLYPSPSVEDIFAWSNWFDLSVFFHYYFYKTLFQWFSGLILTPIGFSLFLAGLFIKSNKDGDFILNTWLAAVVIFDLVLHKHTFTHEYYHLPLLPVASIMIGKTWGVFFENPDYTGNDVLFSKPFRIVGLLLVGVMVYGYSNSGFKLPASVSPFYEEVETLNANAKDNERVIVTQIHPLYYGNNKGWGLAYNPVHYKKLEKYLPAKHHHLPPYINLIEAWREEGAAVFFETRPSRFYQHKEFVDYMLTHYPVTQQKKDAYILFNLREKIKPMNPLTHSSRGSSTHESGNLS